MSPRSTSGEEPPMRRLREKLTKENMWLYVLSILRERPAYPYEISDIIERKFGWRPARVTAYIVLRSLLSRGYVKMVKKRGKTGKMRNYYEITDSGRKLFEKGIKFLEETRERLLNPPEDGPDEDLV